MGDSPTFEINHELLAPEPRFAEMATQLCDLSPIDSNPRFNRYCREACRLWRRYFPEGIDKTSVRFDQLLQHVGSGGADVIQTSWGGVVITLHEHPRVEKFLVIREGGYLALEMHEQKDEWLEVKEGAGLILWRRPNERVLTVESLKPGSEFHFEPGMEHCLIGTGNLLVFERSVDPNGMDQDLVFIYTTDSSSTPAEEISNFERPMKRRGAQRASP